jgi:hypothetical protein
MSPLSRRRNRERMRLSRATYVQPNFVQPESQDTVQPKQAKIKELRDMMKDVSIDNSAMDDDFIELASIYKGKPRELGEIRDTIRGIIQLYPPPVDSGIEDEDRFDDVAWADLAGIDIDADGNLIPDF